ncbi:MAG: hypothetical protein HKN24_00865 [Acidimicrobiales bacterium]|nr:hypothetical protein [Acidimicrobiales bacterium]
MIMNADGSPGVSADVRFGGLAPSGLAPLGWAAVAIGIVTLIGGLVVLIGGAAAVPPPPAIADQVLPVSSQPSGPVETSRWTLGGRSVLPSTVEGRIAVFCTVLAVIPVSEAWIMILFFGVLIFLVLAVRKGDRGLLLLLPLVPAIILVMVMLANPGSA